MRLLEERERPAEVLKVDDGGSFDEARTASLVLPPSSDLDTSFAISLAAPL
jgi:hypothetical protein